MLALLFLSHFREFAFSACLWFTSMITKNVEELIRKALLSGPMPRHMAFIMDGNRRYARQHNIPESQGHTDGYYQLSFLLKEWLTKTNIECMSIYAWSILNFGREESQVAACMKLLEEKLEEFITLCDTMIPLFEMHGVRVAIFGRTELFSERIQFLISKVEEKTRSYKTRRLMNIYLSYTSADEMTRSVEACVNASLDSNESLPIMAKDIEMHLDGFFPAEDASIPPVDILVRTGGAKRFSDFLLWQACEHTQLQFVSTLWPVFGPWDLLFIFLDYQRSKMFR
ncbi:Undecaprenyl diphosphate synthase [Pholiota conissans]|uniref:Alkyl transferase n=1 Tax=Pholiota conissans TaxID=109636 RepID=A0A9P6CYC5_9AGAR|nr:Undecaprenyl diphosphate synthase [Pholiota conissans]